MKDMPGDFIVLQSQDSLAEDDPLDPLLAGNRAVIQETRRLVVEEELHIHNPSGFPYHELRLKIDSICIILRNIDVAAGLVNGTRVQVKEVTSRRIRVLVLTGNEIIVGQTIDLMRIEFIAEISKVMKLSRVQFPLKVAFAMTINKSQGQTSEKVRIY
jgi:hypothetical protein